jgi:hypothetical protein
VSDGGSWLRRAGGLDLPGGGTVLWSVAEGRRGRRWRSLRRDRTGHLVADLLLELDAAGRWARLELTTAGGILTLHPEPGMPVARGNVDPPGSAPSEVGWGSGAPLVVAGDPVPPRHSAASLPGPACWSATAPESRSAPTSSRPARGSTRFPARRGRWRKLSRQRVDVTVQRARVVTRGDTMGAFRPCW